MRVLFPSKEDCLSIPFPFPLHEQRRDHRTLQRSDGQAADDTF
jgi:hypothetical protein